MYFHFLFILKLIKKRKELNSISNKIYLFVTAPFSLQVIYTVIHCYIEGDTMIIINNSSMIPIYEQIVNQVKQNIVDGKLKEGDALPSVRGLSKDLKISALTVKKAYDILEADGLCKTVQGKGSFVLGVNPGLVHEQRVVEIQKDLEKILDKAKSYDLSKEEIKDLFDILMEE